MLKVEDRRWKIEGGSRPYSIFHIPYSVFNKCGQAVSGLGISGVISRVFRSSKIFARVGLCVSSRFMNFFYVGFTTAFAPLFRSAFNQLGSVLMPTIHTTNKYDNILYKLTITN